MVHQSAQCEWAVPTHCRRIVVQHLTQANAERAFYKPARFKLPANCIGNVPRDLPLPKSR